MASQLDPRKRLYLQRMGITAWERRACANPSAVADAAVGTTSDDAAAAPGSLSAGRGEDAVPTMDWESLEATVAACRRCGLCESRTRTVFGVGDREADLLVIGEAPGEQEDRRGEPFVGPAGQLLDQMLRAIGLGRDHGVYIANILKCRPPGNRDPAQEEVRQCTPYLNRQIALLRPKAILAVGRIAAHYLLDADEPLRAMRSRAWTYGEADIPVIVSYHPSYLLRTPADKAKAWQDLKRLVVLISAKQEATDQ